MKTYAIAELLSGDVELKQFVILKGWVRTRRDSKQQFSFLQVHDGSCFDAIQVIADAHLDNYHSEIIKLSAGCAVVVTGNLVVSQGKGQATEVQAKTVEVVGWVENPETYPIAKKRHSFEYLRGVAHLRPRTNTFGAMARVRHRLARSIHDYFDALGFYWVNTPIITASDCEGAGELFQVSTLDLLNLTHRPDGSVDHVQDFFAKPTYLTVSGQLQVESFCLALSKVYTFGPTFRAENSHTSRHLAEFWMLEPEIAFADLNDLAYLAEDFLKQVLTTLLETCEDDLAFFAKFVDKTCLERLQAVIREPFERIDYSQAIEILQGSKQSFEFPVTWGLDLQSEHERYLTEQYFKKPVIVRNYPKDIKAFYMRLNDDSRTCAAMDVLAPGIGEIIGGSQREERLSVLDERLHEPLKETLWWYRELRRYGTVPHAGFGLGFERLLNYVTGMENIRDAIPFPRVPGSIEF